MSGCDCMKKVNDALRPHNTRVSLALLLDSRLTTAWSISTSQIETGRGKPKAMSLFASYCPFCGTSLRKPA